MIYYCLRALLMQRNIKFHRPGRDSNPDIAAVKDEGYTILFRFFALYHLSLVPYQSAA